MAKILRLGRMNMMVYLTPYHCAHLDANYACRVKLLFVYGKSQYHLLVRILNQLSPIHAHI
jgi:hypothetical protein